MTETPRLKLHYPVGTDPADVPSDNGALALGIDQAAVYDQGALTGRPAAGLPGRFFLDPSSGLLYLDTGTAWITLNAVPVELPGTLKLTARATADEGWLLCDGAAVSRTTYDKLYAAIGDRFGAGNGSSTFNLPDYRDKAVVGAGPSYALGVAHGAPTHAHTVPPHAHIVPNHAHGMPDHSHWSPDHLHRVDIWSGAPRDASANFAGGQAGNAAGRNSPVPVNGMSGAADRGLQTSGRAEGGQSTYGQGDMWSGTQGAFAVDAQSSVPPSLPCNVEIKT